MDSKSVSNGILRAVSIILGVALLLFFLYKISSILLYILIGAAISLMGRPLMLFLTRKLKMRNSFAVIICLIIFLTIFLGIFTLFVPIIIEQTQIISQVDIQKLGNDLTRLANESAAYFHIEKFNLVDVLKQTDLSQYFSLKWLPQLLNAVLGGFGGFMIGLFSVVFIAFFALKDSKLLENSLLVFAKNENENKFMNAFNKIKELLSRYFVGLLLQVFILFVMYSILLLIFSIDNAIALALIAAILNLIPYLGPVIGFGLMMALTVTGNLEMDFSTVVLPKMIYISIGYIVIQLLDNFVNQPFIFGNSVRSHPLEIFLAILIMGVLFGIPGLIAAVPFYTAVKVISKEFLSEYKIVQSLTSEI